MGTILAQLKGKLGNKTENQMVSYWCPKMECYVYIGKMTEENEVATGATPEESKTPKTNAMEDIDINQRKIPVCCVSRNCLQKPTDVV